MISNTKLPTRIDSCISHEKILNFWKQNFTTALNEVDYELCDDFLNERLRSRPEFNVEIITLEELCVFAISHSNNKCPKVYIVPNEIYEYFDGGAYELLAMFY